MDAALPRSSLLRSLRIQLRVIGALILREIITRFGRHNLGFLWLFLEPMLFTLGIMGLWMLAGIGHGALPVAAFAITGYSSVLLWRNCVTRCSRAIPPNSGLLYHRNVKVIDLLITRVVLEIAGATICFVALSLCFIGFGVMDWPADVIGVLVGWTLLAWFGASLGLVIGAVTAYSEIFEKLWHPLAYLLFPVSGAVFMVEWLPRAYQPYALMLPMVNGVEILREGYFGTAVRTHYDLPYLVAVCLALTLLGLALTRDAERRVEME